MPSQRDIREKALLSLFSSSTSESNSLDEDSLWTLVLEPENTALNKITVKALRHQLQSFSKWSEQFQALSSKISALLKTYEEKALVRQLSSLTKGIKELSEKVSLLNQKSTPYEISIFYANVTSVKHTLSSFKQGLTLSDYTSPEKDDFEKSISQLSDLVKRVDYVSSPLEHKDQGSIQTLIKATEERDDLKNKAHTLAKGTLDNLEMLDEKIAALLENFSATQIGKVEKNLLRLGAYEILIVEQPKGIAINEALELTKKYATDEAVPLINGVLDKL